MRGGERGQASVEVLGAIPALLLVGLVLFQVGAVGYARVLAGSAAEAGALAMAAGADPAAGAREALARAVAAESLGMDLTDLPAYAELLVLPLTSDGEVTLP